MPARPLEKVDKHILKTLSKMQEGNPKEIAENRYRENVVRVRCNQLVREGLLNCITHDIFEVSEKGEDFIESADDIGDFRESFPDPNINRITDFSELDPEDIKWRNRRYYKEDEHRYEAGQYSHSVLQEIGRVRNGDINRLMEEFPEREPLSQQCAHWVRAITGKHFFPDANHRTAMSTLNLLLHSNGIEPFEWSGEDYKNAIFKSKIIRRFVIDVRFDNLWLKDELYHLWHRYFLDCFYDIPDYNQRTPSYTHAVELIEEIEEQHKELQKEN